MSGLPPCAPVRAAAYRGGSRLRGGPAGGWPRYSTMPAKGRAGFTLIELVVTVAIIGILAAVAMPLAQVTAERAKESELRVSLRKIRDAIDAYKAAGEAGQIEVQADASGYPPRLEVLVEGVADIKSPEPKLIYFLRRIPRDPFNTDIALPPAESWGLRSYASPPDDPQPGDDVFDVYSLSEKTGLNGIAYREW